MSTLLCTTTYSTTEDEAGNVSWLNTFPFGPQASAGFGADGTAAMLLADGSIISRTDTPDPRFGLLTPLAGSTVITTPGALTRTTTQQRTVTLLVPSDQLSLATQSDQLSGNALVTNVDFNAISKSSTVTSPLGRQTSTVLDAQGRVVMASEAGVDPVIFTYDQ